MEYSYKVFAFFGTERPQLVTMTNRLYSTAHNARVAGQAWVDSERATHPETYENAVFIVVPEPEAPIKVGNYN